MTNTDSVSSHGSITTRESHMDTFEMDDTLVGVDEHDGGKAQHNKGLLTGVARHTLGLLLLLFTVFLWTLSNFLGSSIFADATYAKPFFMTYLDTSCFVLLMIPRWTSHIRQQRRDGTLKHSLRDTFSFRTLMSLVRKDRKGEYVAIDEEESLVKLNGAGGSSTSSASHGQYLDMIPTARHALTFCLLWFGANYLVVACLQYTTVASSVILSSTSSIWTLLLGAFTGTEKFTWKKLCGVLASLVGIVMISQVDLSSTDTTTASTTAATTTAAIKRAILEFPKKSAAELALGDVMALLSAMLYGVYTIVLKKVTINALPKEVHMPTFFGFIGLFNMFFLFPVFPILHYTGFETFSPPPTLYVWCILVVNAFSSLVSDIAWVHAMLLTSPLVVTVGMSLTIPLSLIGEMIIQGRFESWVYWVGAMVVVGSFVFVEREEKHEEGKDGVALGMGSEGDRDGFMGVVGEPGPAILVQDYDAMLEELERRRKERMQVSMSMSRNGESDSESDGFETDEGGDGDLRDSRIR